MEKQQVSSDKARFYRGYHEVVQELLICQRWAAALSAGSQPHQKTVLQPFKSSQVSFGGPAPRDAGVLDDGPDMCVISSDNGLALKLDVTAAVCKLHTSQQKPEHFVCFSHCRVDMGAKRQS